MTSEPVALAVLQLLRHTALSGSNRQIDVHDPLGELGLGLDSLALIEFVTALEKRFQVIIPETIWTERGQLTLQHFIDTVAKSKTAGPALPEDDTSPPPEPETGADHASRGAPSSDHHDRPDARKPWPVLSRLLPYWRAIYEQEKKFILEYDLLGRQLPTFSSPLRPVLRRASLEDAPALCAFWQTFRYYTIDDRPMSPELFRERLQSGSICLTAWLGDKAVATDWLFQKGYACPFTGLNFDWPQDTCYAGELYEHTDHRGQGIGMAVLAYSLAEAKRTGFKRQVACVAATNAKMLSASIHLYGLRNIGEIRTTLIRRKPFSSWKIGNRHGRGGTLTL